LENTYATQQGPHLHHTWETSAFPPFPL